MTFFEIFFKNIRKNHPTLTKVSKKEVFTSFILEITALLIRLYND